MSQRRQASEEPLVESKQFSAEKNPVVDIRRPVTHVGQLSRFQFLFPKFCEDSLALLDDTLIPHVQCWWSSIPIRVAVLSITTITAIETALPVPAMLYALGFDAAAGLCTSMLVTLALISQVLKKIIFRPRPWMSSRAAAFRKDATSSFPSRAVICAVVFGWLAFATVTVEGGTWNIARPVAWTAVVLFSIMTALARIMVGAHYPSDTLCGFAVGLLVLKYGVWLETLWSRLGCPIVAIGGSELGSSSVTSLLSPLQVIKPTISGSSYIISSYRDLLLLTPYRRLVGAIAGSYMATLASLTGFWVKCSYVYGLLLAAATFRFVFLGQDGTGVLLPHKAQVPSGVWEFALAVWPFVCLLGLGMGTRGKGGYVRILSFSIIYFGVLGTLLVRRIA